MTKKIRQIVPYIFLFLGLYLLSTVGTYMFLYYNEIHKSQETFNDIHDLVEDTGDPAGNSKIKLGNDEGGNALPVRTKKDFSKLLEENSDFVGWIEVPETRIDYPVMFTPSDEEYYLHRNFYKNYDYSGVPFCNKVSDPEKPSNNIVIYGHHMRSGTMFYDLSLFKEESFYKDNKYFYFDTIHRTGTYEIVAVVLTHVNQGCFNYWELEDDKESFDSYVSFLKSNALYHTDGIDDVEYGDKLVTLSTCSYHVTNGRLIVVGKLVDTDDIDLINHKMDHVKDFEKTTETVYTKD